MSKSTNTITFHKQNSRRKRVTMIIVCCLILIISFLLLKEVYHQQNITLQSTWQSEETGQVLTFTSKGEVILRGDLPSGIYHIISPNKLEYTVDGKTFLSIYKIEDKKLYWGLNENELECFDWVSH